MLLKYRGKPVYAYFPKVASTAFAVGDAVAFDGAGAIAPATSASTGIVGIIKKEVLATDADYASNTLVPVEILSVEDEVEIDTTGTPSASMIGVTKDLTDAKSLNEADASVVGQFVIVGLLSGKKVRVKLLANALA